jgi:N-acylneuraminate cytidylyltransferase
MYDRNVVFIPMRSGSKSIINKNIKLFCEKPLFYWGISAALACNKFDEIIISTDSTQYAELVINTFKNAHIKIDLRPLYLAQDKTSTEDVLVEFFERCPEYKNAMCVLHQITSPFVKKDDFSLAIQKMHEFHYDTCLSVVNFKRFIWDEHASPLNYNPGNRPRRQDMSPYYCENGAIYAFGVQEFLRKKSRLFGKIGFIEMMDESLIEIDEPLDWTLAEKIFERNSDE